MKFILLVLLYCSSFIVSGQTILPLRERAKAIEAIQKDRLKIYCQNLCLKLI